MAYGDLVLPPGAHTPTVGGVTPASWGTGVNADLAALAARPGCLITRSSQSIAHATPTNIGFTAESYDTDTMHSTSVDTHEVVIPGAGVWVVTCTVTFAADATGFRALTLYADGSIELGGGQDGAPHASATCTLSASAPFWTATGGEVITARVYQTSGGNLTINARLLALLEAWP